MLFRFDNLSQWVSCRLFFFVSKNGFVIWSPMPYYRGWHWFLKNHLLTREPRRERIFSSGKVRRFAVQAPDAS